MWLWSGSGLTDPVQLLSRADILDRFEVGVLSDFVGVHLVLKFL